MNKCRYKGTEEKIDLNNLLDEKLKTLVTFPEAKIENKKKLSYAITGLFYLNTKRVFVLYSVDSLTAIR